MGAQPCWFCKKFAIGCSWGSLNEKGELQFIPVDGWIAVPTAKSETPSNPVINSYEIIYCPEFVPDGSENRKNVPLGPDDDDPDYWD